MNISRRAFVRVVAGTGVSGLLADGLFAAPENRPTARPAFRAFKDTSYWNQPIPRDALIDRDSARFLENLTQRGGDHLRLTLSEKWSTPVYWPKDGDPEYTIEEKGKPFKLRLPAGAWPSTGSDAAIITIDVERRQTFSLWVAKLVDNRWMSRSVTVYYTDSNGLDGRLAQSDEPRNYGHRGVPPTIMGVRKDEIEAGAILHKLEMFIHGTAEEHVFPMTGHEPHRGGIIPEGMLLRIKPSVDLRKRRLTANAMIVATALQTYGIIVGDNSGAGNNLKVERDAIPMFGKDDLAVLPWGDWEFIERGYGAE